MSESWAVLKVNMFQTKSLRTEVWSRAACLPCLRFGSHSCSRGQISSDSRQLLPSSVRMWRYLCPSMSSTRRNIIGHKCNQELCSVYLSISVRLCANGSAVLYYILLGWIGCSRGPAFGTKAEGEWKLTGELVILQTKLHIIATAKMIKHGT